MSAKPQYVWNAETRQYEDEDGKPVSHKKLLALLLLLLTFGRAKAAAITKALTTESELLAWYGGMSQLIRGLLTGTAALAYGGADNLGAAQIATLEKLIAEQMKYLNDFKDDLRSGDTEIGSQKAIWRAQLYPNSVWIGYATMVRHREKLAGIGWERRVLGNSTKPCDDCEDYAARGFEPEGSLPDIGDSECGSGCRCHFEFRDTAPPEYDTEE